MIKQRSSGSWFLGKLLRRQRLRLIEAGRRLRLRDIADLAGYESASNLSWIERGLARITPDHVPQVAKAYELDEEEFWLLWSVTRLLDENVPAAVLRRVLDGGDVRGDGDGAPDGDPVDPPGGGGGPAVSPLEPRDRADLEWALATFRKMLGYTGPNDTPEAKSAPSLVLIRNRRSNSGRFASAKRRLSLWVNDLPFTKSLIPESA